MTVNLRQLRKLFAPGMYMYRGRYASDPYHPVQDLDMWVEGDLGPLVLRAFNKDGSQTRVELTAEELSGDDHLRAWKKAMDIVCPVSYFDDETVIAYDDSGWLHGTAPSAGAWLEKAPVPVRGRLSNEEAEPEPRVAESWMPTRDQWFAICFLSLFVYVDLAGSGESYRVYTHLWFGYGATYALIALSAWSLGEMLFGWAKVLFRAWGVPTREEPGSKAL